MLHFQPLVSIILPIFNGESYIISCLNSIKDQDYQNYEIIIIDDGSSDNSLELCKSFSKDYSNIRIQIYSQKNSGVASARNLGIKKHQPILIISSSLTAMILSLRII